MEILDIDLNLDNFDLKQCQLLKNLLIKDLPEMVFKYIRYSKFEISRRCHRCVIFAERNNCLGDANDVRLIKGRCTIKNIRKTIHLPLLW
jgi:hypothetical protein